MEKKRLTSANGHPVADNQNSQTAGQRGPILMQDPWLIEKLAHFDREVIPERRMHAKGSGAYGTFTVTHDITQYTRAAIFSEVYYPKGWKAWIEPKGTYGEVRNGHYKPTSDAQQLDLFRADWILRGAILPEGEGEIIMRFEPDSYQVGENISRITSIILLLLLIAAIAGCCTKR